MDRAGSIKLQWCVSKMKGNETQIDDYSRIWKGLATIYKIMYSSMDRRFSEEGTSNLEYRILRILVEGGRKTMANLADLNFVTQAWITGMTDRMEEKGYVKRVRSSDDRRVIYIELTDGGKRFTDKMRKVHDEFLTDFLSFIPLEDSSRLADIIESFSGKLEKKFVSP